MTASLEPAAAPDRLRSELERLRTLVLDPSYAHPTFADLVLTYGRDYAPSPWTTGVHPQRGGECFAAAHSWANRQGWTYCEGYALAAEPIIGAFEHAWCLAEDGQVADPSVPDGWIVAYRGIPLSATFIRAHNRGDDAVITFGRNLSAGPNTAVLRDGLPPEALVATPQVGDEARRLGTIGS
ncbi:hypothetical protein [Streptomyces sp. NPDC085932]|uniref:hypothetical protein n=1 Tax=Streptomyces sp. NPDC085932 TaxID=3365741 RepID=UPI0037D2BBA2